MILLKKWIRNIAKFLCAFLLVAILSCVMLYARRNSSQVNPALQAEFWPVTKDRWHNSNSDLIRWNDSFYLVHARSRFHVGKIAKASLRILRSADAKSWELLTDINLPEDDLRDPKFAAIGDELFLYVLKNKSLEPEPYCTALLRTK